MVKSELKGTNKMQQIKTQKFILKFFSEIMIKGPKAKREMIGQLYNNLRTILFKISEDIDIKKLSDKMEIVCSVTIVDQVREKLLSTSGIELVLEATQFDNINTIDEIKVIVNEQMAKSVENKTFVVRVKRSGKHEFNSTEIERIVGGHILANSNAKGVDLQTPEVTLNLELIHNQLNIITTRHKGLSGFPLGTSGEIISLMSGGFDSTVASYLMMKRGIKTHFIFFNLGGIAHEIGVKQVAYYLWNKFGSSHKVSFISIAFDDVLSEIFASTSKSYMGVTLKRLMLQASEKIANDMGIDALVTGESIAQVSSQTLRNLAIIDQVTKKLIFRPLSTMNKQEIMNLADTIGTRNFAESMPEYCGVISQNPITHGSYKRMEEEARRFDYTVLTKAVENAQIRQIDEMIEDVNEIGKIEEIKDITNTKYTIVDIREEGASKKEFSCGSIQIPFYRLKSEFPKLPQDEEYLFYCDKGVMSQLHAQYLKDNGDFTNIKVYRP